MPERCFFPEDPIKPMDVRDRMYLRYKGESYSLEYESNEDEDVGGKWMIFLDKSVELLDRGMTTLDYAWQFMKPLVDDYKNTGIIEVISSTDFPGWYPAEPSPDGVICCFTEDYRDKRAVKRAADAIRKAFHYPRDMYYKTNSATHARVYRCFGHKHISIYKHTLENRMYERDMNNLWGSVIFENTI